MQAVELKHLTYTYSKKTPFEKRALDDVNLSIEEGTFLGVIGETGSGKSTLIQHLNGLIKVQDKKTSSVLVKLVTASDSRVRLNSAPARPSPFS